MRSQPEARGSMEEAGKGGGPGQTGPLSRGSSEVSVELEPGTPLRRKKGRTVIDLSASGGFFIFLYAGVDCSVSKEIISQTFSDL